MAHHGPTLHSMCVIQYLGACQNVQRFLRQTARLALSLALLRGLDGGGTILELHINTATSCLGS